jgi:rubrerythrin
MDNDNSKQRLIALLQLAYSGELAAAHAYNGHWRSVRDAEERARIAEIEQEELHHRKLVGEMLVSLGAAPNRSREIRATVMGRTLSLLCHVSGWLAPMYGAGRLESGNVREYETAARFARECGREDLIDCLLTMAEVEWEHEKYFRSRVLTHSLGRRLTLWPQPAPKESIREPFVHKNRNSQITPKTIPEPHESHESFRVIS